MRRSPSCRRSATKPCSRCSAQQTIESLVVKAPLDGVVSVKQNTDAAGGMFFSGMVLPEYREGDSIWPGRPIADVIESGRMELRARVDENDRANLTQGQEAVIDIDTIPGETFKGKVGELSAPGTPHGFLRIELRRSAVRRVVRFRSTRPADEGRCLRACHGYRERDSGCAYAAAAGRFPERQDARLREER